MAIHAGGSLAVPCFYGFSMKAAIIGRLFFGMAGGAGHLGWRIFVRRSFQIGVAVHTLEHAAVNRILKFICIDIQADRLAVNLMIEG